VSAQAAHGVAAAEHGQLAAKAEKPGFALKRSADYSHVGQPGVKVTAELKKSAKGKVAFSVNGTTAAKVRVYNSAIQLSGTTFTVSQENYTDAPPVTGSVLFKDKPASTGWVDIYQDGRNKDGVSSPYYCCDAEVLGDGTFTFMPLGFIGRVAGRHAPGTYSYQAFYTDDAGFDDYIYSTPITVIVTP
jgi:hypothetical protein